MKTKSESADVLGRQNRKKRVSKATTDHRGRKLHAFWKEVYDSNRKVLGFGEQKAREWADAAVRVLKQVDMEFLR